MIKKILSVHTILAFCSYLNSSATETKITETTTATEITKAHEIQDNYINEREKIAPDDEYEIESDGSFPSLFLDWGFNLCGSNTNEGLKTTFLGSRFFDITLCYNLVIPDSHFAVVVGLGYSNKTLSFDGVKTTKKDKETIQYKTLVANQNKTDQKVEITDTKDAMATKDTPTSFEGSYLNIHSWNFIIDFKFFANKMYPKDSFIFSVGGKLGLLWKANTEIDYKQSGFLKTQFISDKSNLKEVSYGLQSRAAWGRFGLVYEILLSDLYTKNLGPQIGYLQKIGISIDLF